MDKKSVSPEEQVENALKISSIKKKIKDLHISEIKVKNEYKNAIKNIELELVKIQNGCPHIWKYYPDPSGNNDSSYTCLVCGKED